jgi:hypothetical protein
MPEYPAGFYESIYIQPELVAGAVETAKREAKEQLLKVVGEIYLSGIGGAGDIADREWLRTDSERGQGNESRSYCNWVPQLLGSWTHTAWQYAGTSSSICALPGLVVQKPPVDHLAGRTEPYED